MRRRFLIGLALGVAAGLGGCGGDSRLSHPWYAPGPRVVEGDAASAARAAGAARETGATGLRVPLRVRGYGDEYVVVDVLVLRLEGEPYTSPAPDQDLWRLSYFHYNGMAAFDAADGRGFRLTRGDGTPIALRSMDLSRPVPEAVRRRYALGRGLETAPIGDVGGYRATVVPVVVRCAEPVAVGEVVCVRLESGHGRVSKDAVCAEVGAMQGGSPPEGPTAGRGPAPPG